MKKLSNKEDELEVRAKIIAEAINGGVEAASRRYGITVEEVKKNVDEYRKSFQRVKKGELRLCD